MPVGSRTRVLVIYAGGTIGMVPVDPSEPDGTRRPGSKEDVLRYIPGVGTRDGIDWELLSDPELPPRDSTDLRPCDWEAIARIVKREYASWDGFVILHGTDTMAYTASALSFLLENPGKPVVFTGSQTPLFHERTDGRLNLIHSLRIAGYRGSGLPRVCEVMICFGKRVVRGNRARKMSATDSDAFESPNLRPLAAIETDVFFDASLIAAPPSEPFAMSGAMSQGVVDITVVPGMPAEVLRCVIGSPRIRGILFRTFGQGNFPSDPDLLEVLASAQNKIIVNVTQCARGRVDMRQYEAGQRLARLGVVSGADLTPEAAFTKLSWLIGSGYPDEEIRLRMAANLRGEMST
jgi:L-asparaginase